jgi:DNA-binding Lrp family transcriptional regulator
MAKRLDEIDNKILSILKQDGRLAYGELGKRVGLSEPAARRRVGNLRSSGVIRCFTIESEAAGAVQAILFVAVSPSEKSETVAAVLSKSEGVERVWEVSGESDFALVITATDMDSLNARVDKVRHLKGIVSTKTSIIMKRWV